MVSSLASWRMATVISLLPIGASISVQVAPSEANSIYSKEPKMMRKGALQVRPGGHVVADDASSLGEAFYAPCTQCESLIVTGFENALNGCYDKVDGFTYNQTGGVKVLWCEADDPDIAVSANSRWKIGSHLTQATYSYSQAGCCHMPESQWMYQSELTKEAFSTVSVECFQTGCNGEKPEKPQR
mmetsp:Transcript_58092/g.92308  ORF Transcript_58092/g.92308 Transcript_58092/m.92308 type:complete len:185 (-) Transcript_58092:31-585(-)|eukprot:CAMPEP_0169071066 /NCGR_PEP_ID=MMETSP1015-20121227/5460_1 /TAXON_ID=342587 /ORGANISM="Karlodinium micrum, Strain CCMP2283" /LENGTH=184 /DNA_ID=CAMNT_0009130125 /DNA_START=62 /DNA_END=616 /DNA_ORIENTATION=-